MELIKDFIDFVDSALPSVDPGAKDKAKAAIAQFDRDGRTYEFFLTETLSELSQGDIISDIKFTYYKSDGKQHEYKAKGMVLSTSCHIDQKQYLNIVPVIPIETFLKDENKQSELKKNRIYDYMYIPEGEMQDYYVDFSKINTFEKSLILQGIKDNHIERLYSLNQFGFYLFIIKLTVFFMRKEDEATMNSRSQIRK